MSVIRPPTLVGPAARQGAGVQQGLGMRLAVIGAVAADDTGGLWRQAQLLYQRVGEKGGFVGDNAPAQSLGPQRLEQLRHAGEQPGLATELVGVALEEAPAQGLEAGVPGFEAEAEAD